MKTTFVKNALTVARRVGGRSVLLLKKYSPELLLVTGIAGVVTGTVLACKATTEVDDILENHKEKMNDIHEAFENPDVNYDENDKKKDTTDQYIYTGKQLLKLYGPAVTIEIVGIGCILGSYGIISKRNVSLMAAYEAISTEFRTYRNRVADKYGEEEDKAIYHGEKPINMKELSAAEKKAFGEDKHPKEMDLITSPYSVFFDEATSKEWRKNAEANKNFLIMQQNYANQLLHLQGHLFLNEVYDALGIPRTKAGAVVGWIDDGEHDSFVDFGISEGWRQATRDFMNGYERSVRLDFNVDGVIFDKI